MPRSLLPPDIKPGDVLTFAIEHDREATRKVAEETGRVQRKLSRAIREETSDCDDPTGPSASSRSCWPGWPSLTAASGGAGPVGPWSTVGGKPVVVEVLDIGQGDSILIRSPEGKTALIDAGPTKEGALERPQAQGRRPPRPGGDQPSSQRPLRRDGGGGPRAAAAVLPGVELRACDEDLPQAAPDGRGPVDHRHPADVAAPQDRAGLRRADDPPPGARGPQGGEQQLGRHPAEVRLVLDVLPRRQRGPRAPLVARESRRPGPGLHDPQAGPPRQPQRHRRALARTPSGPSSPWPAWAGTTSSATRIPRRSACCDASRSPCSAPTSSARSRLQSDGRSWNVVRPALARRGRPTQADIDRVAAATTVDERPRFVAPDAGPIGSDSGGDHRRRHRSGRCGPGRQPSPEPQVPPPGPLDQRAARPAPSAGAGSAGARTGSTACRGTTSPGRPARPASRPAVAARSSGARRASRSTRRSPPPARRATCAGAGRRRGPCRRAASPCAAAGPPTPSAGTAACPDTASGCGTSRTPGGPPRSRRPSARRRPADRGRSPGRSCR